MANQFLLIELKGNHYLYDIEGNAFMQWDNPAKKILFSDLQNDADLRESLGYGNGLQEMKIKMAYMVIQTHALYGVPPDKDQLETLRAVFPSLPLPGAREKE